MYECRLRWPIVAGGFRLLMARCRTCCGGGARRLLREELMTLARCCERQPYPASRSSVCRVISGGQLKRTGTTDDPAPTDV